MNILIVVHGHRSFARGGAENAAFSMHDYYTGMHGVSSNILCASPCHLNHSPAICEIREYSEGQYLIGTSSDYFFHRNEHLLLMASSMRTFLQEVKPDIIHIHHYVHYGADIIPLLKTLSRAVIILTLHEYIPLCHRDGQMIRLDGRLCEHSSPDACSACFNPLKSPEIPENYSANHFFVRDYHFRSCLSYVDHFISPSQFLVDRYIYNNYNGPFTVIENGLPSSITDIDRSQFLSRHSSSLSSFGFFGQLNPFKGIIELLEAVKELHTTGIDKEFRVYVFGSGLEHQSEEFRARFSRLIGELDDIVFFGGAYQQKELSSLMEKVDWTIVPSIWWENSPVVIQESFYFYRPVIGTCIGGIREKIYGKGGVLFDHHAKEAPSMTDRIRLCLGNFELHSSLVGEITQSAVSDASYVCSEHMRLYHTLIKSRSQYSQTSLGVC